MVGWAWGELSSKGRVLPVCWCQKLRALVQPFWLLEGVCRLFLAGLTACLAQRIAVSLFPTGMKHMAFFLTTDGRQEAFFSETDCALKAFLSKALDRFVGGGVEGGEPDCPATAVLGFCGNDDNVMYRELNVLLSPGWAEVVCSGDTARFGTGLCWEKVASLLPCASASSWVELNAVFLKDTNFICVKPLPVVQEKKQWIRFGFPNRSEPSGEQSGKTVCTGERETEQTRISQCSQLIFLWLKFLKY